MKRIKITLTSALLAGSLVTGPLAHSAAADPACHLELMAILKPPVQNKEVVVFAQDRAGWFNVEKFMAKDEGVTPAGRLSKAYEAMCAVTDLLLGTVDVSQPGEPMTYSLAPVLEDGTVYAGESSEAHSQHLVDLASWAMGKGMTLDEVVSALAAFPHYTQTLPVSFQGAGGFGVHTAGATQVGDAVYVEASQLVLQVAKGVVPQVNGSPMPKSFDTYQKTIKTGDTFRLADAQGPVTEGEHQLVDLEDYVIGDKEVTCTTAGQSLEVKLTVNAPDVAELAAPGVYLSSEAEQSGDYLVVDAVCPANGQTDRVEVAYWLFAFPFANQALGIEKAYQLGNERIATVTVRNTSSGGGNPCEPWPICTGL